jgi:hypothetical protein
VRSSSTFGEDVREWLPGLGEQREGGGGLCRPTEVGGVAAMHAGGWEEGVRLDAFNASRHILDTES